MKRAEVTVKLRTMQVDKMPDVAGFLQAMRDLGATVSVDGKKIVVYLRKEANSEATQRKDR